jgi:transcription elongation factor Elf1
VGGKIVKRFTRRRSKPETIGTLKDKGQRLAIYCAACGITSYMTARETLMMDNVELPVLEEFYPCPACGHSNSEAGKKLIIRAEGH